MAGANNSRSDLSASTAREAMERVLSSQEFRDSDRLQAILRYVVEETLAGRSSGIKATTIALEVFERDADDDSASSSIVRVSAARLRRIVLKRCCSPVMRPSWPTSRSSASSVRLTSAHGNC